MWTKVDDTDGDHAWTRQLGGWLVRCKDCRTYSFRERPQHEQAQRWWLRVEREAYGKRVVIDLGMHPTRGLAWSHARSWVLRYYPLSPGEAIEAARLALAPAAHAYALAFVLGCLCVDRNSHAWLDGAVIFKRQYNDAPFGETASMWLGMTRTVSAREWVMGPDKFHGNGLQLGSPGLIESIPDDASPEWAQACRVMCHVYAFASDTPKGLYEIPPWPTAWARPEHKARAAEILASIDARWPEAKS